MQLDHDIIQRCLTTEPTKAKDLATKITKEHFEVFGEKANELGPHAIYTALHRLSIRGYVHKSKCPIERCVYFAYKLPFSSEPASERSKQAIQTPVAFKPLLCMPGTATGHARLPYASELHDPLAIYPMRLHDASQRNTRIHNDPLQTEDQSLSVMPPKRADDVDDRLWNW